MSAPSKALVGAALAALVLHGALLVHFSNPKTGAIRNSQSPLLPVAQGFLVQLDVPPTDSQGPAGAAQPAGAKLASTAAHVSLDYPASQRKVGDTRGYFIEKQIDKPAVLLGEWAINAEPLNDGQVLKVAVRILISAQGSVERWELTDGSSPTAALRESLKDLDRTVFSPAFRAGKPVASQRDVEFIIAKD